MKTRFFTLVMLVLSFGGCQDMRTQTAETPAARDGQPAFSWRNATVYFLLTDRFYNGNPANDQNFNRTRTTQKLRNFEGGDIAGITAKIREGYFDSLGITALWMTPLVEQIRGAVDEGQGATYGYHGYWARDWTRLDPNFGTEEELREMVQTAHRHGIRVLFDVVLNHTGPVTDLDPAWPEEWVRQGPPCTYTGFETTTACTLVENLPDIRTERDEPVDLPLQLRQKWESEGRLQQETESLDAFFSRTNYPRAPRYYLLKWLVDMVHTYGIDGFRVDTAKHTEPEIWAELYQEAQRAFQEWKSRNPGSVLDREADFFMVGEVYGFGAGGARAYDFGDRKVDFYANGFQSLINFAFKWDARQGYDHLFRKYDAVLHEGSLQGVEVLNYLSSHDDGDPFDRDRSRGWEAGIMLLLSPGAAQIYYGDESNRPLEVAGTEGDANLRSMMNWEDLEKNAAVQENFRHWSRLGQFRKKHLAVGAGRHSKLQDSPYVFSREYAQQGLEDKVLIALEQPTGPKSISAWGLFAEGESVRDFYSGALAVVKDGSLRFDTPYPILLLERL